VGVIITVIHSNPGVSNQGDFDCLYNYWVDKQKNEMGKKTRFADTFYTSTKKER